MCQFDRHLLVTNKISPLLHGSLGHVTELLSYLLFVRTCRPRHRQMARESFLWGAPRVHGELFMLAFTGSQATGSGYLPAPCRRSNAVVADLSSQSSQCVRRIFRIALRQMCSPKGSILLGQAHAICSRADCGGGCLAQARPWATTADRERSRNSFVRLNAIARRCAATVSGGPRKAHATVPGPLSRYRSPPYQARASPKSRSPAQL